MRRIESSRLTVASVRPSAFRFFAVLVHVVGGEALRLELAEERADVLLDDLLPDVTGRGLDIAFENIVEQFGDQDLVGGAAGEFAARLFREQLVAQLDRFGFLCGFAGFVNRAAIDPDLDPPPVRFAARFGYTIEPATFAAIQRLAPGIQQVSRERVRDELTKMLTEGHARRAFELLDATGLLREVLPEVDRMHGVEQPPEFHPEGDVWIHTLLLLEKLPPRCSRALAWGALLHDVGKPPTFRVAPDRIRFDGHVEVGVRMAEELCHRLHFSNEDTRQIAALVANHMRFADAERMKESTLKRFLRLPRFDEHLELHRIDCLSSHGNLALYDFVRERLQQTPEEEIRPKPLLTGEDLISLGYQPGPQFRQILSAVEDAQLEGTLHSKDDAMDFVRHGFPQAS